VASEPFRLGLVGAGRMGQTHLRALAGSTATPVVAVAEPVAALRDAAAGEFSLAAYDSVESMLDAGGIDAALIVTPSPTHVSVIETVAAAGLPILCEKPCGVTPEDTLAAAGLVAAARVPFQVAYWRRYVPALVRLRERIGAGELGEILSVSCLQWDGEPPSAQFRARGGGIFVDMGVHEIDQTRWLTGGDYGEVTAVASAVVTDPEAHEPDGAQVLALLSSGATSLISLGRYYPGGDMSSVEVFGTRDRVYDLFLDPADGVATQLSALAAQAAAFGAFARGGPMTGASVDDAVAALRVATVATAQVGTSA
jgi:myo-inositol 2-dehydrogenase / D-chiro-inositol 1-dehydrogenase